MPEINTINTAIINIHSLVSIAKRVEFANFLKNYKPHVMLINETHLKNKHKVSFDGYKLFRSDRMHAGCGGTAICVSDRISCEHLNIPSNMRSLESCSVKIILKNSGIIFSAIYRRPINKIDESDLTELINIDKNAEFVIGGDFNSHSPLWGGSMTCSNGQIICDWFNSNANKYKMALKHTREPTCSVSSSGSYIEFAIVSDSLQITNCDNENKLPSSNIFSDHAVIFPNIGCDTLKLSEPTKIKIYKETNWNKFNEFIDKKVIDLKMPLNYNMSPQAIDSVCTTIESIFKDAISQFVPEVEISSVSIKLSNKSLNLIKEKKRIMRKKHRNRNNHNFIQIKSQLKLVNQLLVHSISDDFREWWSNRNDLFKNIKN